MPAAAGVVQEAGVPARPSISTRHRRQEPNACRLSVAQSLGSLIPASMAARMIDVPVGTVMGKPSTVRVMVVSALAAGAPKSISRIRCMGGLYLKLFPRSRGKCPLSGAGGDGGA